NVGAERFQLVGGTLNGSGTLVVTNEFYWSSGSLNHSGTVTLLPGSIGTFTGNSNGKGFGGGTFNLQGTVTWTGTGQIGFAQGIWNNTGLFECQTDAPFIDTFDGAPMVFNNSGTFRKT